MKFASLFTGIGGFDLGLQRAGMECVLQCDNDKSCLKLLSQKWPDVKRIEDVKKIKRITADIICGGFPCQDVSIAGRREGLAGERSGLWYEFAKIIKKSHPQWVIVENVPGLLSSHGGRDFQTVVESLVEFGYGVAWRILDSRYFGVAQRRRRVFIVGGLGNGRAAEVLFESESMSGNIEKGGEAGEVFAFSAGQGAKAGGIGYGKESPTLKGAGSGTNQVPAILANVCGTLAASGAGVDRPGGQGNELDFCVPTLSTSLGHHGWSVGDQDFKSLQSTEVGVRRLIPTECERLQSFPDGWTEGFSDSTRYRMLGNAVTVNVIEWIGNRIKEATK